VCLARAIVEEPDILVLDEPTSAMDPATEKRFKKQVTAYLNEDRNRILVMATHKRGMLSMVDRVIALDRGKKIGDGPKETVLARAKSNHDVSIAKPDSARSAMPQGGAPRDAAPTTLNPTDIALSN
jgi:ATP-binding cassette subfamily C protein LapB